MQILLTILSLGTIYVSVVRGIMFLMTQQAATPLQRN